MSEGRFSELERTDADRARERVERDVAVRQGRAWRAVARSLLGSLAEAARTGKESRVAAAQWLWWAEEEARRAEAQT